MFEVITSLYLLESSVHQSRELNYRAEEENDHLCLSLIINRNSKPKMYNATVRSLLISVSVSSG